jgi:conjugal transfer mating pair stabilization protein TraN
MSRHGLALVFALLSSTALHAQTVDPQAAASQVAQSLQTQVTTTVTDTNAPSTVPGYGGTSLPQSAYLSNPSQLSGAGSAAAATSQAYAIVTNPNMGSFDTSTLGLTNAQAVEANPSDYTGVSTSTSSGACQPLTTSSSATSTYYDSCQVGSAETDSSFTCTIDWATTLTTVSQYTCHTSQWSIMNLKVKSTSNYGSATDCGTFPTQSSCSVVSTTTKPSVIVLSSGTQAMVYAETDTTYTCSGQTNYGTGASSTYCIDNTSDCFVPSATDKAPGVPGATLIGSQQVNGGSSIDNSACQSQLATVTANGATCLPPTEVCTDASPTTRTVDGVSVTHDCWQWQATYQCGTLTSANTCAALQAKTNCSFDHSVCLDDPQVGDCQVTSQIYKCTTPTTTETSAAYACSGSVYCLNGSCTTLPTSATPDVANALVAINAMGDASNQFDPNSLTIFGGTSMGCHKPLFGLVNCCAGKVSGMLTAASSAVALAGILTGSYGFLLSMATQFLVTFLCSQSEMLLDVQDRMGLCHYVGEYCSQKALFVCTTERKTYCCYQSELARVIQEQGRAQLGLDFGSPDNPSCGGFTVAQFSQLDLSKMDFREVYANFTSAVSLPSSLQTTEQIQAKVQQYYQNAGATGTQTGSTP